MKARCNCKVDWNLAELLKADVTSQLGKCSNQEMDNEYYSPELEAVANKGNGQLYISIRER